MLSKNNLISLRAATFLLLLLVATSCSPPGPRALLKGKKYLDNGNYASAVEQFKKATEILPSNAQAWNYFGVALQHNGQSDNAAAAYKRALEIDRDLTEAHYNLGCLWLEQGKFDSAKTEFTAYTLSRANAPEGWLKLGTAQLRGGDPVSAEKSFSTALYLNQNNAEALNGMGLARIRQGKSRDAAQFFAAAMKYHPDYAPAILNLAIVNAQYLHDTKSALESYHAYLAISPRPADWDAVNDLVNSIEHPSVASAANSQKENQVTLPQPTETKTQAVVVVRTALPPKQQTVPRVEQHQTVETPKPTQQTATSSDSNPSRSSTVANQENHSFNGITPIPPIALNSAVSPKPQQAVPPPVFPRYTYLSPPKPQPGNRSAASDEFVKARASENLQKYADAVQHYQKAAQLDPSWFEAQFNCAVLEYRLRDFKSSLSYSETALAIQPDSTDARYSLALGLKAAGYMTDALNEFKKMLAANPSDARLHLAIADVYAQFRDIPQARAHYLKFLELDPKNSQATNVRYWLNSNP